MECWHVVQAKPGKERQLAVELHQRGLEVYLPLVWVCPTRSRAARERPYFPGYLFAKVEAPNGAAELLRWTPGLKTLVEIDGQPAVISDRFVDELRQRLECVRPVLGMAFDSAATLEPGRICSGPFAGYEGIFNWRLSRAHRASILITCIQREHWQTKASPSVGR